MKSRHLSQTYINATEEIVADGVKTHRQDVYEKCTAAVNSFR